MEEDLRCNEEDLLSREGATISLHTCIVVAYFWWTANQNFLRNSIPCDSVVGNPVGISENQIWLEILRAIINKSQNKVWQLQPYICSSKPRLMCKSSTLKNFFEITVLHS